ncbi:MAG: hypothetical protein HZA79_12625 [Sphingobacteriales bacterium]|nr:hypothetical protein [Sphingobacteriales bacterium]
MNIKLSYLYRDGSNYKNYNEIIFTNKKGLDINEIRGIIVSKLIDETWFYANQWDLPDLHFTEYKYDPSIDVDWHEFENIELTEDPATDKRGIEELIDLISRAWEVS